MSLMPNVTAPSAAGPSTKSVAAAPVDEVLSWLDTSADGLSGAEVSARLARYGPMPFALITSTRWRCWGVSCAAPC